MPDSAAARVEAPGCHALLSMASAWETVIKSQLGKLDLGMDVDAFFRPFGAYDIETVRA